MYTLSSEAFAVCLFVFTWYVLQKRILTFKTVTSNFYSVLSLTLSTIWFFFSLQFGYVLCNCIGWSIQESYQSTERPASHGRLNQIIALFIAKINFKFLKGCHLITQEGQDKRFLIQKLCQAQRLPPLKPGSIQFSGPHEQEQPQLPHQLC